MNPGEGFFLLKPDDLHWRLSNLMKIPNADFLERAGSGNIGDRLWRHEAREPGQLMLPVEAGDVFPKTPAEARGSPPMRT